ncbi:hypothetical protein [Agromyces atrinae]|uniref:hypothetical protein n=1 Tax=Agromyces atrinae TaxID=592376 RepID=UPI0013E91B04|nr:hypothetical protein [Agromyces atrinae]
MAPPSASTPSLTPPSSSPSSPTPSSSTPSPPPSSPTPSSPTPSSPTLAASTPTPSTPSSSEAPSPVDPSDRVLLSRAARGAADAFEELYDRWAPVAYGMCVHVAGDETRAARAMESIWLEFWQNAPSLARRADDVRRVLADLVWAHARN